MPEPSILAVVKDGIKTYLNTISFSVKYSAHEQVMGDDFGNNSMVKIELDRQYIDNQTLPGI